MLGLLTRIIFYILAGLLGGVAAALPGVFFDSASGQLAINLNEVSAFLGALVMGGIGGPTFWISRLVKRRGGVT